MTAKSVDAVRQLGTELATLRRTAGLSGRTVAAERGWNQAKVSRMETGVVRPSLDDVMALLKLYQAPEDARVRVLELATAAHTTQRSWRQIHAGGMRHRQAELTHLLATASRVAHFQPSLIPGLLQTPEYAYRVLELADVTGQGDIDAAVSARLSRQKILFAHEAPTYDVVLSEAALRWRPVGPASIPRAQLTRLLTLADLPTLTLRVLLADTPMPVVVMHPFTAYRLHDPDEPPVVYVEILSGEITIIGEDNCAPYWQTHTQLAAVALPPEESATFIHDLVRSLPTDTSTEPP